MEVFKPIKVENYQFVKNGWKRMKKVLEKSRYMIWLEG